VDRIIGAFLLANAVVILFVSAFLVIDLALFLNERITHEQRVLGERTVIALISAATVQLGGLAIAVGRGLFAKG
jgi:hypothetical protein